MKIEQMVTSLEWSKKLKEAGVPQESEFWWYVHPESDCYFVERRGYSSPDGLSMYICPAYLTGELGEMLPTRISNKIDGTEEEKALSPYHFVEFPVKRPIDWFSTIHSVKGRNIYSFYGNTEANARAQILHYLIKEGLVKPEDLK